jgi:hypothetical protein
MTTDPTVDLAVAHQEIDSLPANLRAIFANWRELRKFVERAESAALSAATLIYAEPAARAGTHAPEIKQYLAHPDLVQLGTARSVMEALDRTPLLAEARRLIEPILDRIADARRREAHARNEMGHAKQRHAEALERATAEALAAARSAPEVTEALSAYQAAMRRAPMLAEKAGLAEGPQ